MGIRTAVLGASGYAGGELVRFLDGHPDFDLVFLGAHTSAGERLGAVHPHLAGGERALLPNEAVEDVDVAFLALPHGASAAIAGQLAGRRVRLVDLGADHRFDDADAYQAAYGHPHPFPEVLREWRYGLPELFDLAGSERVAVPGCYPTATQLAITPLIARGLVGDGPIVSNCLSGVSGAGRVLREDLLFGSVAEGVRAYGVTNHRHRPEIEMGIARATGLARRVTFTPHLVPMQRGLLATVTAPVAGAVERGELLDAYRHAYQDRVFVEVVDQPPQTRWVVGSNRALVTVFVDSTTGLLIAFAAIDNLVKGAAGQAIQVANLMFGLPEATGLPVSGAMP
jgi:N-acetyl-gamma-glutamyl-phosphate reductase